MHMPNGQPKRLQGLCVYPCTLLKNAVDVITAYKLQWLLSVTRSVLRCP